MVLPCSMRLKGHKCFNHLHRSGHRYYGQLMVLRVVNANTNLLKKGKQTFNESSCRCAVTISNKVSKKAVIRNRLRRLLHNHLRYRLETNTRNASRWALISLKPCALNIEPAPLLKECDNLLFKAGLIL